MIILGIDPGSVIVGYSIIKKDQNKCLEVVDFGCIVVDKFLTTGERLKKIYKEINSYIYNLHSIKKWKI